MLRILGFATLCSLTVASAALATDTIDIDPRGSAQQQASEPTEIPLLVRPTSLTSPAIEPPTGVQTQMPAGFTADQDAAVDAALLLPAVQAARESARRTQ